MTVETRLCDTTGKGVGRWRVYYRANDLREAQWAASHLLAGLVRIRDGRDVIVSPRRVSEFVS